MSESGDICSAVSSLPVSDGYLQNFQVQFVCSEEQIEIAERIKIAEIGPVFYQLQVVGPEHDLCSAEGIPESLVEQPGKRLTEKEISKIDQLFANTLWVYSRICLIYLTGILSCFRLTKLLQNF